MWTLKKEQFLALKKGDRFWHENAGVFNDEQLQEIKRNFFKKIIRRKIFDLIFHVRRALIFF